MQKRAIIIGAGPAGLTAAYELIKRANVTPVIIEKCDQVGGISKTVEYKGNRMDFGPHRFFSKSDRVMKWWTNIMPLYTDSQAPIEISYQNKKATVNAANLSTAVGSGSAVPPPGSMLVLPRLTRIYFLRKFFAYPIQLSVATLGQLGVTKTVRIISSYFWTRLSPRKPEKSLEDFLINKFGKVLYKIFFKDYTEKVWGLQCAEIPAEWGSQRIKGVSLSKAIIHAARALTGRRSATIEQKDTETSLIEQFLYPAKGAGAMWEEVARQVEILGGQILLSHDVKALTKEGDRITGVMAANRTTGAEVLLQGDYVISTMPVQEFVFALGEEVPEAVKEVASGLLYRDFVYVGLLVDKMKIATPKDSWIYIQETGVLAARLQIYNNWGPYMVQDPTKVWLGLEYFCNKGDRIWDMTDAQIQALAIRELDGMGLVDPSDVLDGKVNRMEKTYPAYFGAYERFGVIREYLDKIGNLYLIGRNGMHKYNNTDHSMLTAMVAVDNIVEGKVAKDNIWEINTEQEYHEIAKNSQSEPTKHRSTITTKENCFHKHIIQNKWTICVTLAAILIQFLILKSQYPHPNFIPDSYAYMDAAANNYDVNFWPVGYSKFLRVFSTLFRSDTPLILVQYLLLELAAIHLVLSFTYLVSNKPFVKYAAFAAATINPVFLHLANFVTADALFTALSLIWMAQLIWLVLNPKKSIIFTHGLILGMLFMIRYNALYYPIITVLALGMSNMCWKLKAVPVAASTLMISLFIWHTGNQYKEITGTRQFSPFSGWQMANNALYVYSHINTNGGTVRIPEKYKQLDSIVTSHLDSLNTIAPRPDSSLGIYYLWDEKAPLRKYLSIKVRDDGSNFFKGWSSVAPLYYDYGNYIITHNLRAYFSYYIKPNLMNFFIPNTEFLSKYNMGQDTVRQIAMNWFNYKNANIAQNITDKTIRITEPFKSIIAGLNTSYVFTVIGIIAFGTFRYLKRKEKTLFVLFTAIFVLNMLFSTAASPIVMRYQAFMIVPLLLFVTHFGQTFLKEEKSK